MSLCPCLSLCVCVGIAKTTGIKDYKSFFSKPNYCFREMPTSSMELLVKH